MKIRTHIRKQAWMTAAEWRALLRQRRALEAQITTAGIAVSPPLLTRVDNALTAMLLVYRAELALMPGDEGTPKAADAETIQSILIARRCHLELVDELDRYIQSQPPVQPAQAGIPAAQPAKHEMAPGASRSPVAPPACPTTPFSVSNAPHRNTSPAPARQPHTPPAGFSAPTRQNRPGR